MNILLANARPPNCIVKLKAFIILLQLGVDVISEAKPSKNVNY